MKKNTEFIDVLRDLECPEIEEKYLNKKIPYIYFYGQPDISYKKGTVKIGETSKKNPLERIREQISTPGIKVKVYGVFPALDCNGNSFRDKDFHKYLEQLGYKRMNFEKDSYIGGEEWFVIEPETALKLFHQFANRDFSTRRQTFKYELRKEQRKAIEKTSKYFDNGGKDFLWNCKPRFGKTIAAYNLIMKRKAKNVLVITNRPATVNSWKDDFDKVMPEGYCFVTDTKSQRMTVSYEDYKELYSETHPNMVSFMSLQDLKGSLIFGGEYNKNEWVSKKTWDLLIIDECHEGVDTEKTDKILENIKADKILELSGTPFKALESGQYNSKNTYSWTYVDSMRAKESWDGPPKENPYRFEPRLGIYIYEMSKVIKEKIKNGVSVFGEQEDISFDLNEFFRVNKKGRFVHEEDVITFLDELSTANMPYGLKSLEENINHTLWLLPRVASARSMARLLRDHEFFKDYKVVLAAGNGKVERTDALEKSYNKVKKAIKNNNKTITLSVGQLTTGVTIKEWNAVFMLSNIQSLSLYTQASFRCQNANVYRDEKHIKEHCYVFDFLPDRALSVVKDMTSNFSKSKSFGDIKEEEVLNYMSIYSQEKDGRMTEMSFDSILEVLNRVKVEDIIKKKFSSNLLFSPDINNKKMNPEVLEIILSLGSYKDKVKNLEFAEVMKRKKLIRYAKKILGSLDDLDDYNKKLALIEELEKMGESLPDEVIDKLLKREELPEEQMAASDLEKVDSKTEIDLRNRLKSLTSTIPTIALIHSDITLENIKDKVDKEVFLETTGTTIDNFEKIRKENVFNNRLFNNSIKKLQEEKEDFLDLRKDNDISDLIRLHKSNHILTKNFIIEEMLDNFDQKIFEDKNSKFLDPYCKSGNYLVGIFKRLYKGLESEIPDEKERYKHIVTKQLYAICPDKPTYLVSKTLLPTSNIEQIDIDTLVKEKRLEREIERVFPKTKFTAVIGNPPYQEKIEGKNKTNALPIYDKFSEEILKINSLYTSLIIPTRWFESDKFKTFKQTLNKGNHVKAMTIYENSKDIFREVKIFGGVCFFLHDKSYSGKCDFFVDKRKVYSGNLLKDGDVIYDKVLIGVKEKTKSEHNLAKIFFRARTKDLKGKPISTNIKDYRKNKTKTYNTKCYVNKNINESRYVYVNKNKLKNFKETKKVLLTNSGYSKDRVFANMFKSQEDELFTPTYVAFKTETDEQSDNLMSYLKTKLVRYLVSSKMVSTRFNTANFEVVPMVDLNERWNDEKVYRHFKLSKDEIKHIEKEISSY